MAPLAGVNFTALLRKLYRICCTFPASVIFCHEVGLDYVSCSPFRVPVARLAAAHAALAEKDGGR